MPNRLAQESSPYLQQHADNPVDWWPWGPEAFAEAAARDRPVLLSIGYAACHWCHVMAHESFEDATTAKMMNDLFVNVKVDREERPDVDSIYMQAVQAISGHGGWPMTMFLTPDGVPFFGGTYFPPDDRHGMPSFRRILASVSEAWKTRRDEVLKGAETLRGIYAAAESDTAAGESLSSAQWDEALRSLTKWYDKTNGGFGRSPKFPQPQLFDALLKHAARTGSADSLGIVQHSFTAMARGGLYDQLGGGFHRYCVDAVWLVPHFEKMLYDNALLARLAVHLWQFTGDAEARRIAEETFAWVAREMTDARGGWYASLDADSEGHEGKFYVWSHEELLAVLDAPDATIAALHWGASAGGNFEGANILHVAVPMEDVAQRVSRPLEEVRTAVERAKAKLLAERARRVRPARDDKVLAGWNGLMLRAMAEGARAFDDAVLRERAVRAARFLRDEMMRDGRVFRSWRDGTAKIGGFLEDHAAVSLAFLAVHQLTFEREWLDHAFALHATCVAQFWSESSGAWFDTAADAEPLVTRPRDVTDNAVPSGTSLAVELDLMVGMLRNDAVARRRAEYVIATLTEPMQRSPLAFGHLLSAADLDVHGAIEVAIVGDANAPATRALVRAAAETYVPSLAMVGGLPARDEPIALLRDRDAGARGARAFVCRDYRCELPTDEPSALRRQLEAARAVRGPRTTS
jgi:uncharacterized protein YyaL (SSP411 family)